MRLLRLVVPVAVLAAGVLVAAPAQAVTGDGLPGFCPDGNGVTVVVDFQELGGPTIVRCAPGAQASGLSALKGAGFSITGVQRWGESFICRIEGRPGPSEEACVNTPPASAYWSYWHAADGGSWVFSQLGVTARTPPAGSFEGWSFSKDRTAETSPPPRVGPRRPAPSPTDEAPVPDPGTPERPGAPGGPGKPGEPVGPTGSPSPSSSTVVSSAEVTPGPSDAPSEVASWSDGEELARRAERPSGVPTGTLIALGAVVVLAVSGAVVGVRRKRRR